MNPSLGHRVSMGTRRGISHRDICSLRGSYRELIRGGGRNAVGRENSKGLLGRDLTSTQSRLFSSHSKPDGPTPPVDNSAAAWAKWLMLLPKDIAIWCFELIKLSITNPAAVREKWRYLKKVVWDECLHYWNGTKLLYYNIQSAKNLSKRVLQGHSLTRRERKLLTRTSADLFRVVPFSVFVIVPFMELTLPFFLKIFPNLLPSTFKTEVQEQEDMKKTLQLRLDLAKFLQDTVEQMAKDAKGKAGSESELTTSANELLDLIQRTKSGKGLTTLDTLKLVKVFKDEITLENIRRAELVNICKYMGLPAYGGDGFLRFQIRNKIRNIKTDDQMIQWEGAESLTKEELQAACAERGMRSVGLTTFGLQKQMKQWLELSIDKNVPITLLILSRAMTIGHSIETVEKNLIESISTLDSGVVKEAVLQATPVIDNKLKLESLKFQKELIKEEKEYDSVVKKAAEDKKTEEIKVAAEAVKSSSKSDQVATPPSEKKIILTPQLAEALEVLASTSALAFEREKLDKLKAKQEVLNFKVDGPMEPVAAVKSAPSPVVEPAPVVTPVKTKLSETLRQKLANLRNSLSREEIMKSYEAAKSATTSQVQSLGTSAPTPTPVVANSADTPPADAKQPIDYTAIQVKARVDRMLNRIESEIEAVDGLIGQNLKVLDSDGDGIVDTAELAGVIRKMLKGHETLEEAEALASLLDRDGDGKVTVEEILALADELDVTRKKQVQK